ncbi:Helix-turn-helix transcriptional regulator [Tenacibaculum sp. 190130A14a]|uniref:Helix-turn-helix transcriptional regulator n=1 Tax=Tenacibaculum polynesiense TaxID=3137857 RepID=A0ABM9P8C1_9FLAO
MKNKNLLTMKQPELGRKIYELRKQKGLTQEELVEMCNINVRTIQRIEAGETTPRSFTIKAILEALEANLDNFTSETAISKEDTRILNVAWIFGIIYFVFGFIETVADIYQFTGDESFFNTVSYSVVKIISSITFVLFFMGFFRIAKIFDTQLLKIVVVVLMIAYVVSSILDVYTINLADETIVISAIGELIVFGALQIAFGLSLLQLKDKLGTLIQVNAILEIITGALLATVLLATLGLVLLIPTILIEIIVLYKLSRK